MPQTATLPPIRHRPIPAQTEGIEGAVACGLRLVTRVESFAASLAFAELGDLDFPPETGSPVDQASLQAIAPLYLAAELEAAGLLPAVELLAGLFASGAVSPAIGPAAEKLAGFWRGRQERFTADERNAFFARLFDGGTGASLAGEGGRNRAFTPLMIDLTESIYQWEGHPLWPAATGVRDDTRVRMAARQLAANLLPRSGGMTPFAARDILTAVQEALDVVKERGVQALFGAPSVWETVRRIIQRYRGELPEVSSHLARARAGQTILAWLAENLPHVTQYATPILAPGHEVIPAAAAWMQATLELEEQRRLTTGAASR